MSKNILPMILYCIYVNNCIKCGENEDGDSQNPLPFFRRQKEEMVEETTIKESDNDENPSKLVSFLVENVREIFNNLGDDKEESVEPYNNKPSTPLFSNTTYSLFTTDEPKITRTHSYTTMPYKNFTSTPSLATTSQEIIILTEISDIGRDELMHLSKDLKYYNTTNEKSDKKRVSPFSSLLNNSKTENEIADTRRSCIACNNVLTEDCYDPKHKLIPSIVCERDEDLCYSQHTPFGVIDRGCFNANHNLTTYVCSCNLCNYISISEMPYIYSNKQDWVDNVVELSRTRHFRKSLFKDMSCLKCEVNTTTKMGNMLDNANCLEGNVGNVPTEVCGENEICAVEAVKHHGYVWRGCVKYPLYNYWLTLCDSDLCNYDALVSIYDEN